MVVNIKHIGIALLALVMIQASLMMFFEKEIKSSKLELSKSQKMANELEVLSAKWSKKSQKQEFERALELLGVFGVKYELKEVRDKRVLSMELSRANADKVVSILLNRNIEIVKIVMSRVDKYSIKLEMEII